MVVHICCAVDSHFFLQKIKQEFPNEEIVGYFYDPNIHPYSEYLLRLKEAQRSCDKLNVKLFEGEYDYQYWLQSVRGLEEVPEKGERCSLCFDIRLERTASFASLAGHKLVTTTLLVSPKKSYEQLVKSADRVCEKYGTEFVAIDFRKMGGTQEQNILAKKDKLYRQDYCGCVFGLKMQREQKNELLDELFSSVGGQILPCSIEERLKIYEKRVELEEKNIEYKILKKKFLNYRLLRGYVIEGKKVINSYFLSYSKIKKNFSKIKIEEKINNIYYSNKDEIKIIELSYLNQKLNKKYKNIKELYFEPISFEEELSLRRGIDGDGYCLGAIIVLDEVCFKSYEIYCYSELYEDVREVLVIV